ncbi:MAG: response regulator [Deltaproteobacteria bacterium]|nr:response regulator [Deltaproteobacteria bacterium]
MTAKLLIIDDAQTIRSYIAAILENEGYRVLHASNGLDGLRLVREENPDLVLLDIEMPLMDGLECCRRIKQDPSLENIRVIMVTTLSQYSKVTEAFKAGADDYIVKPIEPKELRDKVRELIKFVELRKLLKT